MHHGAAMLYDGAAMMYDGAAMVRFRRVRHEGLGMVRFRRIMAAPRCSLGSLSPLYRQRLVAVAPLRAPAGAAPAESARGIERGHRLFVFPQGARWVRRAGGRGDRWVWNSGAPGRRA